MQPFTGGALVRAAVALILGGVVGTVGTVAHRAIAPWGVVAALVLVLAAGVAVRAWSGYASLVAYAGGLFLLVQVLAQSGPGGDVLVPAGESIGWVWIIGAPLVTGAAAFAPRRWFSDEPLVRTHRTRSPRP
ncbi:MAG: hypothetical protein HHJ14_10735 [Cellulomonas sp.]|uniref:hypothetical protein n=1 Tax=Cellulomonas sp. TaxID=40001 RepID=UPI001845F7AD|nr:hypothetical protein [Cellulomonas sp.]NMM17580.1 hypothetical protein [Cellulomonas sp.]NMM30595.1 hypothetical protein [Cellulomonas sp.]